MMIKVLVDTDYKSFTPEEYAAQFPEPEVSPQPPTNAQRIAALEAAVAELALKEVQSNA